MDTTVRENDKGAGIRVFRNRNFALLFWGVFVTNIAHVFFNFAIAFYLYEVTVPVVGSANAEILKSAYIALAGLIIVFLSPVGGVLADRFNKAKIMYLTDFVRGITICLVGVILIFNPGNVLKIVILFLMNVILSTNGALFSPASTSLLRFIVTDAELQPAASYLSVSNNFQAIIGILFAAVLYSTLGIVWIFIINGSAYILSAISEMFIRYTHKKPETNGMKLKEVIADIKSGFHYLVHEKSIVAILVMALSLNFFLSPIFSNGLQNFVYFRFAAETDYLFGNVWSTKFWYGIFTISLSAAAIIMSVILSRRKTKENYGPSLKRSLALFSAGAVAICLLMIFYYLYLIPINVVLIGVTILMFAIGFANVAFNIPVSMVMQKRVQREMLGKVNAVSSVLSQAFIPIATLIAGALISGVGNVVFYLYTIVGIVIVTTWYLQNKAANTV